MYDLWEKLVAQELYSGTFQEFKSQYSDEESQQKLYSDLYEMKQTGMDMPAFNEKYFKQDPNAAIKLEEYVVNPNILQTGKKDDVLKAIREPLNSLGYKLTGDTIEDANGRSTTLDFGVEPTISTGAPFGMGGFSVKDMAARTKIADLNDWINSGQQPEGYKKDFVKKYNTTLPTVLKNTEANPSEQDINTIGYSIDAALKNISSSNDLSSYGINRSKLGADKYTIAEQYEDINFTNPGKLEEAIVNEAMEYLDGINFIGGSDMSVEDIKEITKQMATRGRYIDSQMGLFAANQKKKNKAQRDLLEVSNEDKADHAKSYYNTLSPYLKKQMALELQAENLNKQLLTAEEGSEAAGAIKAQIEITEQAIKDVAPPGIEKERYTNSYGEFLDDNKIQARKFDLIADAAANADKSKTYRQSLADVRNDVIKQQQEWEAAGEELIDLNPKDFRITNPKTGAVYNTYKKYFDPETQKYRIPLRDASELAVYKSDLFSGAEGTNAKVNAYKAWKTDIDEKNIAIGELYYLNRSPESINNSKVGLFFSSAVINSGLLGSPDESRVKLKDARSRLDIINSLQQEYGGIKFDKKSQENFERTFTDNIIEGTGAMIPLVAKFAAIEYMTGGAGGTAFAVNALRKIPGISKTTANIIATIGKEEIKTQIAGFETGSGASFAATGMVFPKFSRLGFFTGAANKVIRGGAQGAVAGQTAQLTEQLLASTEWLGHDANFDRFIEETYVDASAADIAKKLITDAAVFGIIGGTHLKAAEINPAKFKQQIAQQKSTLFQLKVGREKITNDKELSKLVDKELVDKRIKEIEDYLKATEYIHKFNPDHPDFERHVTKYVNNDLKGLGFKENDLKLKFVETAEEARQYDPNWKDNQKAAFIGEKGEYENNIVIRKDAFSKGVLSHEIFHAAKKAYFKKNPAAEKKFNEDIIKIVKDDVSPNFYNELSEAYSGQGKQEFAEELLANVAEYIGNPLLNPNAKETRSLLFNLGEYFNAWAESKGMSRSIKKIQTGQDVVDFMGRFQYNVGKGRDVSKQLEAFLELDLISIPGITETKNKASLKTESELAQFDFMREEVSAFAKSSKFNSSDYAEKLSAWAEMVGYGDYGDTVLKKINELARGVGNEIGVDKKTSSTIQEYFGDLSAQDRENLALKFTTDNTIGSNALSSMLSNWQKGQDLIDFIKTNNPSEAELLQKAKELRYNVKKSGKVEGTNLDRIKRIAAGEEKEQKLNTWVEDNINVRMMRYAIDKMGLRSTVSRDEEGFVEREGVEGPESVIGLRRFYDPNDVEQPLRESRKAVADILKFPDKINKDLTIAAEKSIETNINLDFKARVVGGWKLADGSELSANLYKNNTGQILFDGYGVTFSNARGQKELALNIPGVNKLADWILRKKEADKNWDPSVDQIKREARAFGVKLLGGEAEVFYNGVIKGKIKNNYKIDADSWQRGTNFYDSIKRSIRDELVTNLRNITIGSKENPKPKAEKNAFVESAFPLFKKYFSQNAINKRFAEFKSPLIDAATGKQAFEGAQNKKLFKKRDITLAEWRKYFIGGVDAKESTINARQLSLVEVIAEEMAFDAVMEKLYDTEYKKALQEKDIVVTDELVNYFGDITARSIMRTDLENFASLDIERKIIEKLLINSGKGTELARFFDDVERMGFAAASNIPSNKDISEAYIDVIKEFLINEINIARGNETTPRAKTITEFAKEIDSNFPVVKNVTDLEGKSLKQFTKRIAQLNEYLPQEMFDTYGKLISRIEGFTSRPTKDFPFKINGKTNPNAILLNNKYFETNVNERRSAKSGMIPKDLKNKFLSIAAKKVKFSRSDSQSTHLNQLVQKVESAVALKGKENVDFNKLIKEFYGTGAGVKYQQELRANRELLKAFIELIDFVADKVGSDKRTPTTRQQFIEEIAPMFVANDGENFLRLLSPFEILEITDGKIRKFANEHLGIKSYFAGQVLAELYNGTLIDKSKPEAERLERLEQLTKGYRSALGESLNQEASDRLFGTQIISPYFKQAFTGANVYNVKFTTDKDGKVKKEFSLKPDFDVNKAIENLKNHIDIIEGKSSYDVMLTDIAKGINKQIKGKDIYTVEDAATALKDFFSPESNQNRASLDLTKEFDDMLTRRTGLIGEISPARASELGKKQKFNLANLYIDPSANDFELFLYRFMGKGKEGDKDKALMREALIMPFSEGEGRMATYRQNITEKFKKFNKNLKAFDNKLDQGAVKQIKDSGFTVDQALRVWIWQKSGYEIPGIGIKEKNNLFNIVAKNPKLLASALAFKNMLGPGKPYPEPTNDWFATDVRLDVHRYMNGTGRKKFLEEFIANKEAIFTPEFYSKAEAGFGKAYVDELKTMLDRMTTGQSRPANLPKHAVTAMNYINGFVGNIMFLNSRSSILQTISMVNFLNWTDNNIAAAGATVVNNPKNFAKTFMEIMNSDFLKQRRSGLQINIEEAEIAAALQNSRNPYTLMWSKLVQLGYTPTKFADSFAIAIGGTPFYINRTKTYLKQGLPEGEAKKKAFEDFRLLAETHQQSSRQDKVSNIQTGLTGRFTYAFNGAPFQFSREFKKAILDIAYKRGDFKTNVSKAVYYGSVQNILFYGLQQALFAAMFDEEEMERSGKRRKETFTNTMLDGFLRTAGIKGAVIAMVKNAVMAYLKEEKKGFQGDPSKITQAIADISPALGSKHRAIVGGYRARKYLLNTKEGRKQVEAANGFFDNPLYHANARIFGGVTNLQTNRVMSKVDNVQTALNRELEIANWKRTALMLGWDKWTLGFYDKENEETDNMTRSEKLKAAHERKRQEQWIKDSIEAQKALLNPEIIKNNRKIKRKNLFN